MFCNYSFLLQNKMFINYFKFLIFFLKACFHSTIILNETSFLVLSVAHTFASTYIKVNWLPSHKVKSPHTFKNKYTYVLDASNIDGFPVTIYFFFWICVYLKRMTRPLYLCFCCWWFVFIFLWTIICIYLFFCI